MDAEKLINELKWVESESKHELFVAFLADMQNAKNADQFLEESLKFSSDAIIDETQKSKVSSSEGLKNYKLIMFSELYEFQLFLKESNVQFPRSKEELVQFCESTIFQFNQSINQKALLELTRIKMRAMKLSEEFSKEKVRPLIERLYTTSLSISSNPDGFKKHELEYVNSLLDSKEVDVRHKSPVLKQIIKDVNANHIRETASLISSGNELNPNSEFDINHVFIVKCLLFYRDFLRNIKRVKLERTIQELGKAENSDLLWNKTNKFLNQRHMKGNIFEEKVEWKHKHKGRGQYSLKGLIDILAGWSHNEDRFFDSVPDVEMMNRFIIDNFTIEHKPINNEMLAGYTKKKNWLDDFKVSLEADLRLNIYSSE